MTDTEQKLAAAKFAADWKGKGYEKGQSQPFWLSLLRDVYGVEHPEQFILFEEQVHLDHTSFIDGFIPTTKILIEQKGLGKDLKKPIPQSDGSLLTPFQQAKRYITELPVSQHPRWVVTCNFEKFFVYDMERPGGEPEEILLENLPAEYYRLSFLVDSGNTHLQREMEVSMAAGEMVGKLYDAFHKQYADPDSEQALKSLNVLCVRLVFCLYAEDAGIFGRHGMFHDYLAEYDTRHMRKALVELFKVLDTMLQDRDPYLKDDNPSLAAFPYVNGGLFADENIEIPPFTDEIRTLLLDHASADFNWSEISPTIFGAVFESTLNPETRRTGGMHYTSIENIHKVIDPLFLDDLRKELEEIKTIAVDKTRNAKLRSFQSRVAGLTFLDPACGSGNFLTETYLSLRRLENEVIRLLSYDQLSFGDENINPIQVSIGQFYGIEINDFAVTVAKTALWIAESQMLKETEEIVRMHLEFLPLKSYTNIIEGNALRMDWEEVVPKEKLNYIMGNPPFVGHQYRSKVQVEDMERVFDGFGNYGKLDYVSAWYKKAADLMIETKIIAAFVSTNSIVQGESVATMWEPLFTQYSLDIIFAYRTFQWDSEANAKAKVHCVIVGFCLFDFDKQKMIYQGERFEIAQNINGYLLNAPNIFIKNRGKNITKNLPKMSKGSQPTDGGNLLLSAAERDELLKNEPISAKWIHRFMMGDDFINNKERYCLWLVDANPSELKNCKIIRNRVEKVREIRLKSPTKSVQNDAQTPTLFTQRRQPKSEYMAIPRVSSKERRYIPIGFLEPDIIAGDKLQFIETNSRYIFGILISNVHMAWMRVVAGRLKSDYSYSPAVYNNFPWPTPTDAQKAKIEQTAQAILDARALYPDCSLADLYDELTMPPELRKAHQQNDRAVMQAYGFSVKDMTESQCVAELMRMYQRLTTNEK